MADPAPGHRDGLRSAAVINGRLELVLNNTLNAIEDGRRRVMDFVSCGGQTLDEAARHNLEVVFEELVANIIRHGFMENTNQSIHVRVDPKPDVVEFVFEDDGTPFNPLEMATPKPFTSIEEAKIGGLGILLIAQLSSKLHYEQLTPCAGEANAGEASFLPCNRLLVAIPVSTAGSQVHQPA